VLPVPRRFFQDVLPDHVIAAVAGEYAQRVELVLVLLLAGRDPGPNRRLDRPLQLAIEFTLFIEPGLARAEFAGRVHLSRFADVVYLLTLRPKPAETSRACQSLLPSWKAVD
jgi:hypothetical protein